MIIRDTTSTTTVELLQELNKLWANYETSITILSQEIDELWKSYETLMQNSKSSINNPDDINNFMFINLSNIQNRLNKLITKAKKITNEPQITNGILERAYSLYDIVNISICSTGFASCR